MSSKVEPGPVDAGSASAGGLASCCATCCCVSILPRETLPQWMLVDTLADTPPSLFHKLCLCECGATPRVAGGIGAVPELAGMAGATLQRGEHSTAGSVQTLKWGRYDPATRTVKVEVFGGFGAHHSTMMWTEPVRCPWCCLINLARFCDYSYKFRFSEDFKHADIAIMSNCCCLLPCVPSWCAVPGACAAFEMTQVEEPGRSLDGTHWSRNSSTCGGPFKKSYDLVEVFSADGQPGRFHADFAAYAPQLMLISR